MNYKRPGDGARLHPTPQVLKQYWLAVAAVEAKRIVEVYGGKVEELGSKTFLGSLDSQERIP